MLYGDIEGRMGPDATEIDTFEVDMSEYSGGVEASVVDESNVTPSAKDGTTLARRSDTSFGEWFSFSGDGLNYYPDPGDVFRCWLRFEDDSDSYNMGFVFGAVDTNNYYRLLHTVGGDTFIQEFGDQGQTLVSGATYNPAPGEWFEIEVQFPSDPSADPIIATAYDEAGTSQGSVQSTHSNPHLGSGVGQEKNGQNNSSFDCYWDWYRQTGTY